MDKRETEQCRKRKEFGGGEEEEEGKMTKIPAISDGENQSEVEEDGMKEEMIMEVMKWLELEITCPSSDYFYHASSFVTINGNEETCGPSFSDTASTVMASIDTRGIISGVSFFAGGPTDPEPGIGSWAGRSAPAGATVKVDEEEDDDDEEWLARVIGEASFKLDESFL